MLEPIFEFLNLEEIDKEGICEKPGALEVLEFDGVSFSYPGTGKKILEDLSFTVKKGESIALVGKNNSGKSTIVKLICRLFEPDQGRILWNGTDIREFSYKEYMEELSTVFQDFKLFPISILENVSSQIAGGPDDGQVRTRVKRIIKDLNMEDKIEALPRGLDTKLDKLVHEEATELSGGQEQKIAIARALYQSPRPPCRRGSL